MFNTSQIDRQKYKIQIPRYKFYYILKKTNIMKLKTYTKGMLAIAAAGLMMSCSSNDTDVEMDNPLDPKQESYALAFVSAFGQPDPNNDWGFEKKELLTYNADGTPATATRGVFTNRNQYGTYYETPAPLTDEQKDVVRKWFQTHKNPKGVTVVWKNFFCQQVYKGNTNLSGAAEDCKEVYTTIDKNGATHTIIGSNQMNKLFATNNPTEHINDFNAGTYNGGHPTEVQQNDYTTEPDMITLMLDCPTKGGFGFHDSYGSAYTDSYVVIPGDMIDESVSGMYFVGFDYRTKKDEAGIDLQGDGYYSDWIVKVTEGFKKGTKRIIAEDLEIGDFDFNDVVFDAVVYNDEGKVKADIKLLAAGGTMPLYIQGQEVHALFGVSEKTVVNLGGMDKMTKDPVFFTVVVDNTIDWNKTYTLDDISVVVNDIELHTLTGKAPEKICVERRYDWTNEGQSIYSKYPKFREYVRDRSVVWY